VADPWRPFLESPERSALFTDFDGTLSDVVDDPAAAPPRADAVALLEALAERFVVVGVLSGRPLSFLEPLLPNPAIALAGLYGLEMRVRGKRVDHPSGGVWREAVADVVASAACGPAGMRPEAKGVSLTLHYRGNPEIADAVTTWAERQARRTGLVMRTARMSVELHPPIDVDKGSTILTFVRELSLKRPLSNVCFLGDDAGDIAAFDALDALAADGLHTVKVAAMSPEAVPELLDRADMVVDGPEGCVGVLRTLSA
jgi:trehalose 6-phosphate phosphatase